MRTPKFISVRLRDGERAFFNVNSVSVVEEKSDGSCILCMCNGKVYRVDLSYSEAIKMIRE